VLFRSVVGYQRWDDVLFVHWPVPPDVVRPLVDARLPLDLRGGQAWLTLTPLTIRGARLRGLPPLPLLSTFHELNLRTYVRPASGPAGIWFFSLDAASTPASAAARAALGLPYFPARIHREVSGTAHRYASDRIALRGPSASLFARWTTGAPIANAPGSLEHFLVERHALYTRHLGRLWRVRVRHVAWPLEAARVEELRDSVSRAAGLPPCGAAPLAHFSPGVDVAFFPPERAA